MVAADGPHHLVLHLPARHRGLEAEVELLVAHRLAVLAVVGGEELVLQSVFRLRPIAGVEAQEQLEEVDLFGKVSGIVVDFNKLCVSY